MHYRTRPRSRRRRPAAAMLATAALLVAAGAGCNLTEPSPFDPRAMQRPGIDAAANPPGEAKRPLPTTLESPFLDSDPAAANGQRRPAATKPGIDVNTGPALGTDPTVRMTLQEILQRTVANNGEIRVAGYTPAIDQARVIEAEARFDPTLFSNVGVERRTSTEAFPTAGAGAVIYSAEAGLRQLLQSGGQVEVRYRNTLNDQNEPAGSGAFNAPDDPIYATELVVQLQQPLLRDFGNEVNRARIEINRRNQHISLLEFRRQLEETLSETERTYWQLVQAEREVRIQEALLQRTIDTAYILLNRERAEGDVTRVQLSQANASVEQRRSDLIDARSRVRDLSDQLKRAMQDPTLAPSSPIVVLPAAPPVEIPVEFDKQELIQQAYLNRLEIGQQQLRIDNADIASQVAKNNLLPQLNLNLTGGLQGVDGVWIEATGDAITLDPGQYSFSVALQFEIPIGNRAARSIYARAMLQRMQAIEQYRSLLAQVDLEVSQALRAVDTSYRQIAATRQARFAAADALASIERRKDGGEPLTPTFVQLELDRQEALANAARQEVAAISNYNIAISRLELAKGTLLRYNNIILEEEQMPFTRTMGYNGR